jgi:hypothetical protein
VTLRAGRRHGAVDGLVVGDTWGDVWDCISHKDLLSSSIFLFYGKSLRTANHLALGGLPVSWRWDSAVLQ